MSRCQVCGKSGPSAVLLKVQWFGRGTKWLCLECVRAGPVATRARGVTRRPDPTAVAAPDDERPRSDPER